MMDKQKDLCIDFKAGFQFDPDWSVEEAFSAGANGPLSPFHRWYAWNQLETFKKQFYAGDQKKLFHGMHKCAAHGLPFPNWIGDEFCKGFHAWHSLRKPTLDSAFDLKRPKGIQMQKLRRNSILMLIVPREVEKLKTQGMPVDQALFDKVADGINLGSSIGKVGGNTVKNLYYKYKDYMNF